MGNETSILKDVLIDDTPIMKFCNNEYSLHHANKVGDDKAPLSVFLAKDETGDSKEYLKLMAKNLKLYRHPFILRFVDSCEVNDIFYLFTEKGSPLAAVLKHQSHIQVCLGLQNIIQAMTFLHDIGTACHNNLCQSAILVTAEGRWKLAGMEFVTKFDSISQSFLEQSHSSRYEKAIAPEEKSSAAFKDHRKRDIFSLGVLIEEVLTSFLAENALSDQDDELEIKDFLGFAKKRLQSEVIDMRPSMQEILQHPYFRHDYLQIVSFLTDLPVKSSSERREFFMTLTPKLISLPEKFVSGQLSQLLLSRIVLLDPTASQFFLPNMLTPAKGSRGSFLPDNDLNPILSHAYFQESVIPILTKIFHVRDIQIRSVLLRHFPGYCHLFPSSVLEEEILSQLLLGVRDNHDELVADSLRALADLVPLIGAAKVIGVKHRRKIFTDGRPRMENVASSLIKSSTKTSKKTLEEKQPMSQPISNLRIKKKDPSVTPDRSQTPEVDRILSQRHSPIGAETSEEELDENSVEKVSNDENSFDKKSFDAWDNWDVGSAPSSPRLAAVNETPSGPESSLSIKASNQSPSKSELHEAARRKTTVLDLDDINSLDIKTSGLSKSSKAKNDEHDFFADMTPVISEAAKIDPVKPSKFDVLTSINQDEVDENGEGWGGGWE